MPKVILCYEAGYDGFWLARFLERRGIDCLVMDPASLQVTRHALERLFEAASLDQRAAQGCGGGPTRIQLLGNLQVVTHPSRRHANDDQGAMIHRMSHWDYLSGHGADTKRATVVALL